MQLCPDCGIYETPQPSEKVKEKCNATLRCDGCDTYLDHLQI